VYAKVVLNADGSTTVSVKCENTIDDMTSGSVTATNGKLIAVQVSAID
jgi:hypothetical protein